MNIILGVTASIAAYKAADIASRLTKQDRSVHVVMTAGATPVCDSADFADFVSSSRHHQHLRRKDELAPGAY